MGIEGEKREVHTVCRNSAESSKGNLLRLLLLSVKWHPTAQQTKCLFLSHPNDSPNVYHVALRLSVDY